MSLVKLMLLVGGKATPIGSCHPGQARLLQKAGRAEWKDGKLWLIDAAQEESEDRPLTEPTTHTAQEFFDVLRDRILAGHHLIPADDPHSLLKGFADQEQDDVVSIRLSDLKRTYDPLVSINIDTSGQMDAVQRVFETVSQALALSHANQTMAERHTYLPKGHPASHDPLGTALSASARKALAAAIAQPPLGTPPTPIGRTGMVVRLLPEEHTPAVPADFWVYPPLELDDEALLEAGVEPGEWQDKIKFRSRSVSSTKDCEVSSFRSLLREYRRRVGLGHPIHAYDDHQSRMVGFLDDEGTETATSEYVCVSLTRIGLAGLTDDDATPFGMPLSTLMEMLRTPTGREQVFGKWASEGTEDVLDDDPCIEWGDGGVPETPPEFFLHIPVGSDNVVQPVDLTPKDGESPADRAAAVAQERASQPRPPRRVTGWTSFRWPEAHTCTPVYAPINEHGDLAPHPPIPEMKEQAPLTGEGFFQAPDIRYGVYRRVKDHLFRVWTTGVWDESVMQDDGTYNLSSTHTPPTVKGGYFEEAIRLVEARLAEIHADTETTHEFSGWTAFHMNKSIIPPVYYMEIPEGVLKDTPHRFDTFSEEEVAHIKAQMVRVPFPDPSGEHYLGSYGLFQVVGDHLFRVWNEKGQCYWDESIRAPDGTYDLKGQGRSIDKIYGLQSNKCDLLSPSGFPENVRDAERRIAEYLASPEGDWVTKRYPDGLHKSIVTSES